MQAESRRLASVSGSAYSYESTNWSDALLFRLLSERGFRVVDVNSDCGDQDPDHVWTRAWWRDRLAEAHRDRHVVGLLINPGSHWYAIAKNPHDGRWWNMDSLLHGPKQFKNADAIIKKIGQTNVFIIQWAIGHA